jgi:hypothetical protein
VSTDGFEETKSAKAAVGLEQQGTEETQALDDIVTPPKRFSSLPTLERHSLDGLRVVDEQVHQCASPMGDDGIELPELDALAMDWSLSNGAISSEIEHHIRHRSSEAGLPVLNSNDPLALSAKIAATKRSSKRKSLGSLIELLTLSHHQQEQEHSDPLSRPPSSPLPPQGARKKGSWNFQSVAGVFLSCIDYCFGQ